MRTITEAEALEIANLIQEFGKKLYGEGGAKALKEAKKFLNEEPCWEEKNVGILGFKGICIIGGAGVSLQAHHAHHDEVFIIDAQMIRESLSPSRQNPELADFPWDKLDQIFRGPKGIIEQEEFPIIAQRICDDFDRNGLELILKTENEFFGNRYYNRYHVLQKKHEHFFRSKAHVLKNCKARVFRGPWLARGNISQF